MSGHFYGDQAQIRSMQPKSMYVHGVNHFLQLVLQELRVAYQSIVEFQADFISFCH